MNENANFRKFNLNAKKLNFERGKKPNMRIKSDDIGMLVFAFVNTILLGATVMITFNIFQWLLSKFFTQMIKFNFSQILHFKTEKFSYKNWIGNITKGKLDFLKILMPLLVLL